MRIIYLLFPLTMLFSCSKKYTKQLTFQSCTIKYDVLDEKKERKAYGHNMVGNQWRLESAKQELALCLCEKYLQEPNTELKSKILEIYNDDFYYYERNDLGKKIDFDSILKNRKEVFDYRIMVD